MERFYLSNKPKLVITPSFKNQIDYLHQKEGSKEWSGELITSEEGVITDLDNWTITCQSIFLADIGSGAFTGYEVDKGGFKAVDIVDMFDAYPDLLEGKLKNQHIHTHHSMGAFFSGTDWENLHDRALAANYFMMLVVDFKGTYKAKVAFKANVKNGGDEVIEFANNLDGFRSLTISSGDFVKEMLIVMECDVIMPDQQAGTIDFKKIGAYEKIYKILQEAGEEHEALEYLVKATELCQVDQAFIERYNKVKQAVEADKHISKFADKKPWVSSKDIELPFNKDKASLREEDWEDDWSQSPWIDGDEARYNDRQDAPKQKPMMQMTDKEWNEYMKKESAEEIVWQDKDAFALINSVLDEKTNHINFNNPLRRFLSIDKSVPRSERKDYAEAFVFQLRDNFDVIYPKKADEDYCAVIELMINKLKRYKDCKLVEEIIDALAEEHMETQELIEE